MKHIETAVSKRIERAAKDNVISLGRRKDPKVNHELQGEGFDHLFKNVPVSAEHENMVGKYVKDPKGQWFFVTGVQKIHDGSLSLRVDRDYIEAPSQFGKPMSVKDVTKVSATPPDSFYPHIKITDAYNDIKKTTRSICNKVSLQGVFKEDKEELRDKYIGETEYSVVGETKKQGSVSITAGTVKGKILMRIYFYKNHREVRVVAASEKEAITKILGLLKG